jgi:thiol-disulfide isomerase/thioredoxin
MLGESRILPKAIFVVLGVAFLGGVLASRLPAAEKPLSQDEVVVLLLAGTRTEKMLSLIEQRGVDFRMNPDLAQKFHNAGADDLVIEALQKAGARIQPGAAAPPASPAAKPEPPAPASPPSPAPEDEKYPLAPSFTLEDIAGQKLNFADYKGQVVAINFWATWCARCRAAIPRLVELQDKYRAQGLRIIGLSVDDNSRAVREYLKTQAVNYPVAMADWKLRKSYGGISGIPTTFLIGRDGRVYFTKVGVPDGARLASYLQQEIETLLNSPTGKPPSESEGEDAELVASVEASPVPAAQPAPARTPKLTDPAPEEIPRIIQEFATKEKLFKEARNNYTYHQINKVEELDPDGNVVGTFIKEWDVLFDDAGRRIEPVTYSPPPSLKRIIVTKEDLDAMRNIQPFVLTTDELPDYDVKYLGHVVVPGGELTTYVFSIRPKEIKKDRLYFQGTVWVDDRDLQIVLSEGKSVPETKTKKGENLFPRFKTYREQIDGKYWFPTFTIADDKLYFSSGAVRIKQVIRYTDYKQFKSKVRILSTEVADAPPVPSGSGSPAKK